MVTKPNFLLEYGMDSLLKSFNPERKPIMKKSHFFKLMNILDTRLKNQGIDIELPGYWYKYGFYSEPRFFNMVPPRNFKDYTLNNTYDNIVPPLRCRRKYEISKEIRQIIDSTIYYIVDKYRFVPNYLTEIKKESYKINSPYKFNTTFQDYIEIVRSENVNNLAFEKILDKLLLEFPDDEFSELSDTYFNWDDTTRLILECVDKKAQWEKINSLMEKFWEIYSLGVKWRHNQNIPIVDIQSQWKKEYFDAIPYSNKKIEKIRKNVLLDYYEPAGDEKLVKGLMKKAYEMSMGV